MIGFLMNLIPNTLRGQVQPDVLSLAPSRKWGRQRRRPSATMAAWTRMAGQAFSHDVEDSLLAMEEKWGEFTRRPIVSVNQRRVLQTIEIPEIVDLRVAA